MRAGNDTRIDVFAQPLSRVSEECSGGQDRIGPVAG